tara:strand:- start:5 stop:253 length:249 start_codon:yes stop_codon:yes gene_type:complete
MKIKVNNNVVFYEHNNERKEIHPIWLRERISREEFLDKKTNQKLFDPSFLENIYIEKTIDSGEGKLKHLKRKICYFKDFNGS